MMTAVNARRIAYHRHLFTHGCQSQCQTAHALWRAWMTAITNSKLRQ